MAAHAFGEPTGVHEDDGGAVFAYQLREAIINLCPHFVGHDRFEWRVGQFQGYADHMRSDEFREGMKTLEGEARARRVAVMCAEAVWWQCHRMLLSDTLVARDVDVQHIMGQRGKASAQPHRLTPFAQIRDDGKVWYPGLI